MTRRSRSRRTASSPSRTRSTPWRAAWGECLDAEPCVVVAGRADGGGRAGDDGLQGAEHFVYRPGLTVDARLFAVVAEDCGGDLPARVAVDARLVHVEVARHVLRQT